MMSEWTLGRRLAAGFMFAGAVLLVIAVVAYRSTTGLIENDRLVEHTYQVKNEFSNLLSSVEKVQTGQRGYLISGEEYFLDDYRSGLAMAKPTLERLVKLTSDNASQQRRLSTLTDRINARLAFAAENIELRRSQGLDAAIKAFVTRHGKSLTDEIRKLIAEGQQEESALLAKRAEDANASAQTTIAIILWGTIIGLAGMSLMGWFIIFTVTRQIGGAVGHMQSASSELQAAASQQATGAREQATALNEITVTISELLATSKQIADSAQKVTHIAGQTAATASGGNGTVEVASQSIGAIRQQVDQIVNHMMELGRKSQDIGSVLDIVSELAEQTNILSINATIEAAGAGESGKRFAVVADEIRKLSDRVGGSAKEIRTLIDEVRSTVNRTVMATEAGSKSVDVGARQFADVAVAFRAISDQITTTTDAAREIELSTKQQTTAVEQVNLAVANVAQASSEAEASSGQTLQTSTQLTSLAAGLLRLIRRQPLTV